MEEKNGDRNSQLVDIPQNMKGQERYLDIKLPEPGCGTILLTVMTSEELRIILNEEKRISRNSPKPIVCIVIRKFHSKHGTEISQSNGKNTLVKTHVKDCTVYTSGLQFWITLDYAEGGKVAFGVGAIPGENTRMVAVGFRAVLSAQYIGVAGWTERGRVLVTVIENDDLPDSEMNPNVEDIRRRLSLQNDMSQVKYLNLIGTTGYAGVILNENLGIQRGFTAEAWVRTENFHIEQKAQTLITGRNANGDISLRLGISSMNKFRWSGIVVMSGEEAEIEGLCESGRWNHIAVTYSPALMRICCWVNGIMMSNCGVNSEFLGISRLILGATGPDIDVFEGGIAAFRLWSRVLSRDEIRILKNPEKSIGFAYDVDDSDLEIDLGFDGIIDDVIPDRSPSKRNAMLSISGWQVETDTQPRFA